MYHKKENKNKQNKIVTPISVSKALWFWIVLRVDIEKIQKDLIEQGCHKIFRNADPEAQAAKYKRGRRKFREQSFTNFQWKYFQTNSEISTGLHCHIFIIYSLVVSKWSNTLYDIKTCRFRGTGAKPVVFSYACICSHVIQYTNVKQAAIKYRWILTPANHIAWLHNPYMSSTNIKCNPEQNSMKTFSDKNKSADPGIDVSSYPLDNRR